MHHSPVLLVGMIFLAWLAIGFFVGGIQSKQGIDAKDDAALVLRYSLLWPLALVQSREKFAGRK